MKKLLMFALLLGFQLNYASQEAERITNEMHRSVHWMIFGAASVTIGASFIYNSRSVRDPNQKVAFEVVGCVMAFAGSSVLCSSLKDCKNLKEKRSQLGGCRLAGNIIAPLEIAPLELRNDNRPQALREMHNNF